MCVYLCACAFYSSDSFLWTVLTEPAKQGFCSHFYDIKVKAEPL